MSFIAEMSAPGPCFAYPGIPARQASQGKFCCAKFGGGDGNRTHVRNAANQKHYMLSLRLFSHTISKTQIGMKVIFVILHQATIMSNLTWEFYLLLYELIRLTDTSN